MPADIAWKDYYSVNDPQLDAEHKQIIKLINELFAAMRQHKEDHAAKEVLERLIQYTLTHFKHEEAILERVGYPDVEAHKALHARLRQQTIDLRENLSLVTGSDVLYFLKQWWLGHIQGEDKKYSGYLSVPAAR